MELFKDYKKNEKENENGNENQKDKALTRNLSHSESIKGYESINVKVAEKKEGLKNISDDNDIGNSRNIDNAITARKKDF